MRLSKRLADLERRLTSAGLKSWVRIMQYENQTKDEAVAAYEADHGPLNDDQGVILRVIIHKPVAAPAGA